MGPTGQTRVVQIHPSRRCNLRCLHCYSSSSPDQRDKLEVTLLFNAVSDAAAEGYHWVSVSGGEPLMYSPLYELLQHTHACGLHTALTTNGMLLDGRRLDKLSGLIDLIAISIDGVPESHNRIRASPRAFEVMCSRLQGLREREIPFGFIFTLTQTNLNELEWVVKFALDQGAKLVQVHALDEVGFAAQSMVGERPDNIETAYAWVLAQQLQKAVGNALLIQVDLFYSEALKANPALGYAQQTLADAHVPLADIVSPLIIEADGHCVPLQYGISRAYALGSLHAARLSLLAQQWRTQQLPAFHALCREVYTRATQVSKPHFFSWYDLVAQVAAEKEGHHTAESFGMAKPELIS